VNYFKVCDYTFEKSEWLFFFRNLLKHAGWKAIYKQFWKHIKRPWSRKRIAEFAPTGYGLEIGCGTWTIAPASRTILSDAFASHAGNHSLARVFFDASNIPYPDRTFSFVLSEHVLEHVYDPITTLKEWKRILCHKGKVFLFLPHKERMFDKDRKLTELSDLKKRLIEDSMIIKNDILDDWMEKVINPNLAEHYKKIEPRKMLSDGTIHYNVWKPKQILDLLCEVGFKVLFEEDRVPDRPDSFLVIAQKNDQLA
jgi:SAM-dependent methyltransferase